MKRRILRLYPIYALAVTISYVIRYPSWSFHNYLITLLTIGYYLNGGVVRFDWYLECIFSLYLIFPILYKIAQTKYLNYIFLAFLYSICAVILSKNGISWWYVVLIARLPVYYLGALYYHKPKGAFVAMILGLLLFLPVYYKCSMFLAYSFPCVLIALLIVPHINLQRKVRTVLERLGDYSLEIYTSNMIVALVLYFYEWSIVQKMFLYTFLQLVFAIILVLFNRRAQNILHKHNLYRPI